jgi:hypothetical protein
MNEKYIPTRNPRAIGPATLIAIAAISVYAFYNFKQVSQPKTAPRTVRADFKIPNEPDTAAIINARERLSLNDNQIKELGIIIADWQKQSAPAAAKMRLAYENMGKFLNTPPKKPPKMQELMRQAGPLSDATAEYIKIRDAFQARAGAVLTPEQKSLWVKIKKENEVLGNEK